MLRAALYGHAFNPARASTDPGPPATAALGWARHHCLPLTALADPAVTRRALEALALAIFNGLADGHIDRKLFTTYCNAYFNQQTLEDFAASLKPLGPPLSFKETKEEARGGMIFRVFTVTFPERELKVTTYEMPDGKLEQYLVMP